MEGSNEPKRKRRRLSFSLRQFLLFITAFAVCLALWINAAKHQKVTADWVRSFNRTPYYSYRLAASGRPASNPEPPIPKWFRERLGVDFFYSIKRVHLDSRPLRDISLLSRLYDLRHCELASCEITDITALADLKKLEVLSIMDNRISDIAPIAGLRNLRVFAAMDTDISDLAALRELDNLEIVSLMNAPVQDLTPLADHPSLTDLDIAQTEVTDITPLKSIKSLALLNISGTRISEEDVADLQKALPNCKITR